MIRLARFSRRLRRLHAPTLALVALLQRSPALRGVAQFGEYVMESPAGSLLKSAAASAAALGAVDSVAGASSTGLSYTYQLSTGTPGHPSPYSVIVNTAISAVAFQLISTPAQNPPQSWAVGPYGATSLPPGLKFGNSTVSVDATAIAAGTNGVNLANPTLFGTPTATGTYKFQIQAYQLPNAGGYSSSIFTYTVVVTQAPAAPAFTTQPANLTLAAGSTANFTVVTSGAPEPTYQWTLNGINISGATAATLTIPDVSSANAGSYACVATNSAGSATSTTATLTVLSLTLPSFTTQPVAQTVTTGSSVVFKAAATGSPVPTYQWNLNGSPIQGATAATLLVSGATTANAGNYTCTATNSVGSTASAGAELTLANTSDPGRLVNLSCRAGVGTGSNLLIAGFAVGGNGTSGSEPLLIRASGPALTQFGVTGILPDPELQIFNSASSQIAENHGWAGSAAISSAAAAVNAFAWPTPAGNDAAILASEGNGAYTAQVSGFSGDTGVSLAEVYDATPKGTYTPTSPRLINLSSRVQVGTGANILIAGFVIGGSTSKTVLVRASGPALAAFKVTGTLPDPQLKILDQTQKVVASNSGWAGDPSIQSVANSVGAFAWGDSASADSAILVTLPPGAYTAQVAGAAGTATDTGVALVEVYDVP